MSTFRQRVQATTNWVKPDPEDLVEEPRKSVFSALKRPRRDAGAEPEAPVASRSAASRSGTRRRKAPPVTAHRLFPAFAALWFAALFGLGSLAISGDVLGRLVSAIGLPALVPAAAPPLGFTAHLLVAFALAVVGAMLGIAIALRLRPAGDAPVRMAPVITPVAAEAASDAADVYKVRARDAHPDARPRRPLVLTEAFAGALAAEPAAPEEPLLRRKPSQLVSEPAADSGPWIPEFTPGGLGAVQPLDLAALDLAEFDVPESDARLSDVAEPVEAPFAVPLGAGTGAPFALPFMQPEPEPVPEPVIVAEEAPEVLTPDVLTLADYPVEPVVESAPDVGAEAPIAEEAVTVEAVAEEPAADEPAAAAPVFEAAPALIAATPQLPAGFVAALPDLHSGSWSPVAGAPLENLGLVQLIERLALAIAARKAADQAFAEPAVDDTALPFGEAAIPADGSLPAPEYAPDYAYEPELEPEPEPEFEPGPFSKPQAVADLDDAGVPMGTARAAILRRLGAVPAGEGESAGDSAYANASERAADGVPPFSRPAVVAAPAVAEAVVPLHPAADQGSAAADAQADAAPAPASSPFEADDALRSALATLQRMSVRG